VSSRPRPVPWLIALIALVAVACVVHLARGGGSDAVRIQDVVPQLLKGDTSESAANVIVWQLRMPRMLAALLAGAILGAVGAVFQAYFRNALAEPYVIGVSSGAGLGGTIAVVVGFSQSLATLGSVVLAFLGGLLSLWLVLSLARRRGAVQVHTLLLAGVVTSAMLSALMTTVLMLGGQDTGRILRWLLGSLTTVTTERLWAMAVVLVLGLLALQGETRALNAFSVGEFTSERLGVDPRRLRAVVLTVGTAMVAVAVGAVGIIGFLGLMAPHISRRLLGIDLRWSLLGSALCGSALLLASDLAAQNIHPDFELPVGAVTALIGAPALLWLLKKEG
jgi:iron complex transport system permease protein